MVEPKATLLKRLGVIPGKGLSLQAIANWLNTEVCRRSAASGTG
jgi:hypothetical protein